jgi:small-conductance mechanosensitive channel
MQWILMQRRFGLHFEGQWTVATLLIVAFAAAPAILQWLVLRRLVPNLSFLAWIAMVWVGTILTSLLWLALWTYGWDAERSFSNALFAVQRAGASTIFPWLQLMAYAAFTGLLFTFVPVAAFGVMAHRSWRVFLLASVGGVCVAFAFQGLNANDFSWPLKSIHGERCSGCWRPRDLSEHCKVW